MVTSLLAVGEYDTEEDTGIRFDEKRVYADRSLSIVFRGSLQLLHDTFHFGSASEVPDAGQTRMYCAGPQSARMIPGTLLDPHWQATITWIGLHNYIHGLVNYIWRLTPLWGERDNQYPQTFGDTVIVAGTPYMPSGAVADLPCAIHDHVPGFQVEGVMLSNVAPYPSHPYITALLATLGVPSSADMVNYAADPAAGYNYSKRMPVGTTGATPGVGVWFPGSIEANRTIEPMDGTSSTNRIYQTSFPVRWLPRKTRL
jgi:hypothetical protein